jgi:hypothetical protein
MSIYWICESVFHQRQWMDHEVQKNMMAAHGSCWETPGLCGNNVSSNGDGVKEGPNYIFSDP